MKCGYKYCKHGGEVEKDVAVKHGSRYYHQECLIESKNKEEIRKLFIEKINRLEVVSNLNKIINDIVNKKEVSSEYLLFALKYVVKNKLPLNHAPGLFYIVNNDKIKQAWEKNKTDKILVEMKNNNYNNDEINFKATIKNNNAWEKILGG